MTEQASKKDTCRDFAGRGPRFFVNIEGVKHPWPNPTITTEEVAELGGWDPALGVLLIDHDNNERTLVPGEIVHLRPGMGFAKRVRFRRGGENDRIHQELGMLRRFYKAIATKGWQWVLLPDYVLPSDWAPATVNLCFEIPTTYPGTPPYGLYVNAAVRYQGQLPQNYTEPAANQPPFPGRWSVFSWQPDPSAWKPASSPGKGPNLVNWVQGFAHRFREGC